MSKRWDDMDDVDLLQLEAEMREELQDLREAATLYAGRAWERSASAAPARVNAKRGWMTWAAAGSVAMVLVAGGVRLSHQGTPQTAASSAPTVRVKPASPVSDEALLEQIQSDLASGVPAAMEPLQASDARGTRDAVRR